MRSIATDEEAIAVCRPRREELRLPIVEEAIAFFVGADIYVWPCEPPPRSVANPSLSVGVDPLFVINRHGAHGRACAASYLERQAGEDELRVHHFL